jgi:hypothetical protein
MMRSPEWWARECAISQIRSDERRGEPPEHFVPRGWEWLGVAALLGLVAVLFAVYILLWAAT